MTDPSWSLVDAEALAREHKYTFFKPSSETISKVQVGENVKLIFRFKSEMADAPEAERMWVIVNKMNPDGSYVGSLDNEPYWIKDLKAGDEVAFQARHIISTKHSEPDNIVDRFSKRCFATQRILKDGAAVGYLYRETPDDEDDSGWRLTANDESQEYMDEKSNIQYVSLGRVLSSTDAFIHLLGSEVGAAFVLDTRSNTYLRTPGDA